MGHIGYYILFFIVVVAAWVEGNVMWSQGVINKDKSALLKNNALIIGIIGLVIFSFWKYSWRGGLGVLLVALFVGFISARRVMKGIVQTIREDKP